MSLPEKTSAEAFRRHLPGTLIAAGEGPAWTDHSFAHGPRQTAPPGDDEKHD
jgi:hypothetical protein